MKERPILFNTDMVKALLDGHKTQTRRPVKPQPNRSTQVLREPMGDDVLWRFKYGDNLKCPLGVVGDRLWVRETWRITGWIEEGEVSLEYKTHNSPHADYIEVDDADLFERLWIQSSDDAEKAGLKPSLLGQYGWKLGEAPTRWRPSIHMPRWACRTVLEITDIRVERVQDISEEDCMAEGLLKSYIVADWPHINDCEYRFDREDKHGYGSAIGAFRTLWNSVYDKRGLGWNKSPFVWVITFKRITD